MNGKYRVFVCAVQVASFRYLSDAIAFASAASKQDNDFRYVYRDGESLSLCKFRAGKECQ